MQDNTTNEYPWADDSDDAFVPEDTSWKNDPIWQPLPETEIVIEAAPATQAVTRQTVEWVDPHTLRVHPRNKEVYGDMAPPPDLLASIAEGWSPTSVLEALPDGTLIKGHLRRFSAMQLHIAQVPVHYREDLTDDEAAQVRELLADNAGRVKTRDIVCREWRLAFATFKEETGSVSGEKSRDVVGKRYGVSGVTLEHGIGVINAVDNRKLDGETRAAILKALLERGIEPAWKLLRKAQQGAQDATPGEEQALNDGEEIAATIAPSKRHKALQAVLKCLADNLDLLRDTDALVAALPRENWDATMAECQTATQVLSLIECELRDQLDAKSRRKPASRQGRKPTVRA